MRASAAARAGDLPVALDIDPCVPVEPARVAELLTLELTVLTDAEPRAPQPLLRARIVCDGPVVIVALIDRSGATVGTQQLDWAAPYPPGGRSRVLALALSELIARRWREAAAAPAAAIVTEARPSPPALRTAADRSGSDPRRPDIDMDIDLDIDIDIGLLAGVGQMGRPQTTAAALDLTLDWHLRSWLSGHGDGRATAAGFDTSAGTVSARTLSVLLAGLLGWTHDRLWLGAGPAVRGGWAWLRGQPNGSATTGRALNAAWWGPALVAAGSVRATRHLVLMLNLEAGVVARPVIGDVGAPAPAPAPAPSETVAVDGVWLVAAAGAAWLF